MKRRCLVLFLVLISGLQGVAQNHVLDSLRNVLKTEKEDTNKMNTLNKQSEMLWRIGRYDSSMANATKDTELEEKLISSSGAIISMAAENGLARTYKIIGVVYRHHGNYSKALEYDFKALDLNQKTGNKNGIASIVGNIGIVYWNLQNYDKALEFFEKALAINQETGNKSLMAADIGNIGILYRLRGNNDSALAYDFKALDLMKQAGDKDGIATNLGNIGIIYMFQGNYSKALEYDYEAISIIRAIGEKSVLAENYTSLGNTYTRMKKYPLAKAFLDSAVYLSKCLRETDEIESAYIALYALDSAMGNYYAEAEDLKKAVTYRDSLTNDANTKKIIQVQMNAEFDRKSDSARASQEKLNLIAEKESQHQKMLLNSFIGGFVLMLAIAFFIFMGYRQKQKANTLITQQKELVEEKNKDITDSINYAKRIQRALLKEEEHVTKHLPEHFILFKPKDIVSGDFYWAAEKEEYFYSAAVDCTGHGVPGGFMSMLGMAFLNEIIKGAAAIQTPAEILDALRTKILTEFKQKEGEDQTKDGMDISLMRMNLKTKEIQWSGANNPLYCINDELNETPADKQPIGYFPLMKPFTNHIVKTSKGSMLYLFSDGYADQFGGPKGKKFKHSQFKEALLSIHNKELKEQKRILNETFENWKGGLEQVDDILVIGIRV